MFEDEGRLSDTLRRIATIAAVMIAGVTESAKGDDRPAPTHAQRVKAGKKLEEAEARYQKSAKTFNAEAKKSIEALETSILSIGKVVSGDKKHILENLKVLLEELKEKRTKLADDIQKNTVDLNRTRREFLETLAEFHKIAGPIQVANRNGVKTDGIEADDTPDFLARTGGGRKRLPQIWVGEPEMPHAIVRFDEEGNEKTINIPADITQHALITTRIVDETLAALSGHSDYRTPHVGRVSLMPNVKDMAAGPDNSFESSTWANIYANLTSQPAIISNSTGGVDKTLADAYRFDEIMQFITRGDGTTTVHMGDVTVTDGEPRFHSILCNAIGNDGYNARMDFDPTLALPNSINFGAAAIPPMKDEYRRSKSPLALEGYSTGAGVDVTALRPRWNKDGSPVAFQYMVEDYKQRIAGTLCTLAELHGSGEYGIPTPEEWDVIKADPKRAKMYDMLQDDVKSYSNHFRKRASCDENGLTFDLAGTSFSAPVGGAILEDMKLAFPAASRHELVAALFAASQPLGRWVEESGLVNDNIPHYHDAATGSYFAPRGPGHGAIDNDAGVKQAKEYLKLMEAERHKLTTNPRNGRVQTVEVEAGFGKTKHKAVLDGQPVSRLLTFSDLEFDTSEEMVKRRALVKKDMVDFFRDLEADVKKDPHFTIKDFKAMNWALECNNYEEALLQWEKELKRAAGAEGEKHPEYSADYIIRAGKMVTAALEKGEFTYTFKVPEGCDLLLENINLYLKFRGDDHEGVKNSKCDAMVTLESPTGERIMVPLSDCFSNTALAHTSGFMNKAAIGNDTLPEEKKGVWKIHTLRSLRPSQSRILFTGSRRDKEAGELSVVETALLPHLETTAAGRTHLPENHIIKQKADEDPHAALRNAVKIKDLPLALPENVFMEDPAPKPVTPQKQMEDMGEFIRQKSQLYQNGFIPKHFELEYGNDGAAKGHKTSMLDTSEDMQAVALAISRLDAQARGLSGTNEEAHENLQQNWGALALAAAHERSPAAGVDKPGQFFAKANDPDVPFHARLHRREQIEQSRKSTRSV